MMPNMNPKQIQRMMKQLGIDEETINCKKVIFVFDDKQWIFENPDVNAINMRGQKIYQVTGEFKEELEDTTPEINEEDIELIIEKTNVSKEKAIEKLNENNGDIAKTILDLSQ